jgi:Rad3-related DNA helicase
MAVKTYLWRKMEYLEKTIDLILIFDEAHNIGMYLPKISELVSSELSKKAVVVFDEAHNIGMYLPKISELVSSELSKKAVVVFDEAHNIGMPNTDPLERYIHKILALIF